jgi:hypothetical protein
MLINGKLQSSLTPVAPSPSRVGDVDVGVLLQYAVRSTTARHIATVMLQVQVVMGVIFGSPARL